jgi:hypothetical protein
MVEIAHISFTVRKTRAGGVIVDVIVFHQRVGCGDFPFGERNFTVRRALSSPGARTGVVTRCRGDRVASVYAGLVPFVFSGCLYPV